MGVDKQLGRWLYAPKTVDCRAAFRADVGYILKFELEEIIGVMTNSTTTKLQSGTMGFDLDLVFSISQKREKECTKIVQFEEKLPKYEVCGPVVA